MILKSRTLILVLLSSGLACAQSGSRESLAELPSGSSREQSVAMYETAVEMVSQLHDPKLLASTYYHLGAAYWTAHNIEKAIGAYERSRENFERAGSPRDLTYVLADLGVLYLNQEEYQKAREYSERSIGVADSVKTSNFSSSAGPEDFGRARALQTLAEIDLREGNHTEALDKLQKSLKLFQQLNGDGTHYDLSIAGVYAALGKVYPEMGDYGRALFYLNKALDLAKGSRDTTANILNSIGYLYMEQEDYAQAKINFDRSLEIHLGEKNHVEAAKVYLNLGVIEQRQERYDEALAHFNLSMKAAKAAQITDVQVAAGEGIGVVLTAKKDFVGGLGAFNQSLAIVKETKNKTRQIELLWRLAQAYYQMGNYAQSASLAVSAVELARASHLPKLTYLATTTLGESYSAQKKYDLAMQVLTDAVSQLEALRENVAGSELETQLFLENKVASYNALVDLLVRQDKPFDALLYAERAKGRVLLDVLRDGKPDLTRVLTQAEKAQAQALNRRISEINDTIRKQETTNSSSLNSLYSQLDAARLEYQSLQDATYAAHPDLRIRSGQTSALTPTDVSALPLDTDMAYLEYVTANDHVFLFVLTKGKSFDAPEVKVYPIAAKPDELIRKVNQFHDALAEHKSGYRIAASELYSLLIAPAEQQLRNVETLCIIPDSFLWNLPFQALMTSNDQFVTEKHAIYYAPSLSVLREMGRKKAASESTGSSLIAFGNPVIGKDEQRNADVCPLPEAEQEVSSIAKSFDPRTSKVLIGRDATEKTFKALAPAYSVVHLATHGVIDNRQPLYSHLLLTKTEGDPDNDGRLEARQIMAMNLQADLAVLSACETANGRIAPGEGVMGMSWAFFVAGTRSMLVSQWKINSDSTSELMVNFYKSFTTEHNSDSNKARALREAVLPMIKQSRYRDPFYWAGFVMIGVVDAK
jgi:CHAT domain-containing protein/Tfp pilus assembly protein PilF